MSPLSCAHMRAHTQAMRWADARKLWALSIYLWNLCSAPSR